MNLRSKALHLLELVEAKVKELEQGPPAARVAAVCLKHGVPPSSLRRAKLEGLTLKFSSRAVALSEEEARLLRIWVEYGGSSRTLTYYTSKALRGLGLRVYDVYVLRRIVEGQPPRRIPYRLLRALEALDQVGSEEA